MLPFTLKLGHWIDVLINVMILFAYYSSFVEAVVMKHLLVFIVFFFFV